MCTVVMYINPKKIETKDEDGKPTGWLLPLWNALDNPELRPEQVYVTVVAPRSRKGPHLHKVRRGCFVCIKGNVRILMQRNDGISTFYNVRKSGEENDYRMVIVPAGIPCAIYNDSATEDAYVLNMPSPAWSKDDPDDWPVANWAPAVKGKNAE